MKRFGVFVLVGCMVLMMLISGCGQDSVATAPQKTATAKEVVVATSSSQFDSSADDTTQTASGPSSVAFLFNGNSGHWASWCPEVSGTYEIYARVPTGLKIPGNTYYKVSPDGVNTIFARPSGAIDQDWVKLESFDQKTVFAFNENGHAYVFLGEDEEGFPANASATNVDNTVTLPVDALKFVRVDTPIEGSIAQPLYTDTETQAEAVVETGSAVEVNESTETTATAKTAAKSVASISSIGGYSAGSSVSGAKWQGQPSGAPRSASNKYLNYYAIDSKSDSSWTIKGSGFGSRQGAITFSDSKISCKVTSWKDNEIKLTPKVPHSYTYNSSVTLTIYVDNGTTCVFGASKKIPVVGLIKTRGYGQCTWYAAYKRLDNGKSIPDSAYGTKSIGTDYEPKRWDYLSYGSKHVSVITSDISKSESSDKSGNKYKTYKFTVGEMNAKWDEATSSYSATFEVKTDKKGKKSVTQTIGSNAGSSFAATGYYR